MALIAEIGLYLESLGIATRGVNMFGGLVPGTPDNLIAITQPRPGESILAMAKTLDHVSEPFTVTSRHTSSSAGYAKAWEVYNALNNFTGYINSIRYLLILGRGIPFDIGPDQNQRYRWSCDYWASKIPS